MATPSSSTAATAASQPPRERLAEEDFEVPSGQKFDPVDWVNARLAKNGGVPFAALDKHLSLLGMSVHLCCQDTSESIEMACNQLATQLPSTSRDVERMQQQVVNGRGRLFEVLDGLKEADDKKRSGLHGLAEVDAVKTRVETACSALREVGSWERRVRDCEQLVHSGNLPPALAQLTSLKEVLDAFRMLPEYGKKEEQLSGLEESLLRAARRKARLAAERSAVADLQGCCEVLAGMGKADEPVQLAVSVFQELAEKAWQGQALRSDASAGELGEAVKSVFQAFTQGFDERRELLQLLDSAVASTPSSPSVAGSKAAKASRPSAAAGAARAALLVLCKEVDTRLGGTSANVANSDASSMTAEESTAHARASKAVAVLAAYVDGFEAFSKTSTMLESPDLVVDICRDDSDVQASQVLPWSLLREVALFGILRPMRDEAMALAPGAHGAMRPSEAVLAAESSAKRLLQMGSTWAQRLEQQGIGRLAIAWLACVDETCAGYWRQWASLFDTFKNTMDQSANAAVPFSECTYDAALLNECMQLHGMLHDSLPVSFATFQSEVLQLATRMATASTEAGSPVFGRVVAEKLRDPAVWCDRLAVPSVPALQTARTAVLGGSSSSSAAAPSAEVGKAATVKVGLPASSAALGAAEKEARGLVTRCCVQPVSVVLVGYSEEPHWTITDSGQAAEHVNQRITSVGDHLFSLVPQLERTQDSSSSSHQFNWLPTVLEAVVEAVVQQALQIKKLSVKGADQLVMDLEYVQKVTDALGSSASGSAPPGVVDPSTGVPPGSLAEFLEALVYLMAQQRRRQECAASGEAFAEAPRVGAPLSRRFERPLRTTLGLDRPLT